ncbi:MAG TPA: hypothetical protein VG142_18790 [Trebonia sp.]|nr:hypothetical protein [Trebonia sp.]
MTVNCYRSWHRGVKVRSDRVIDGAARVRGPAGEGSGAGGLAAGAGVVPDERAGVAVVPGEG